MDFQHSGKVAALMDRLERFMARHIYPVEEARNTWTEDAAHRWEPWPQDEVLKEHARAESLWNLFLPLEYGRLSGGLTNLEYAPLAEIMGRVTWAPEIFNCSAPDTGNMEVLAKYGSAEQQQRWLQPLLDGRIRSAYAMTEPQVASSDATNIQTSIELHGNDYVIKGRKWWMSGVRDPRCQLLIVMGKSNPQAPRHQQHSMILVPRDTPGIEVLRSQTVFGRLDSPGGHSELVLREVRVPAANLILGEGRGFEIAQGRLGPGRIHHCMRSIGQAQRALELMCKRVAVRVAFGKTLGEQGSVREDIARSFCEIEMARLLTLKAADRMDRAGNKAARDLIAAIKIVAPSMAQTVLDRAIQAFGGMGVSDDTPIAGLFGLNRFLRLTDGPDQVHMAQLGKLKIEEYASANQSGNIL